MNGDRLRAISRDYVARHRERADRELRFFADLTTDEEAVSRAALAQLPSERRPGQYNRHPHQYRIPGRVLEESRTRLIANISRLRAARTFDDLLRMVAEIIGPISGIGELAVYDTALRIGARFNLFPKKVYLHAGTRDGARAVGLAAEGESVEMEEIPEPLRGLTPREVEDVLCIYKAQIVARAYGVGSTPAA